MKNLKTIKPLQWKNHSRNIQAFARSPRFPPLKENDDPQLLLLPSTLTKRTCSFGLGKRLELKSKHCQDTPSPTRYTLKGSFGQVNHSLEYKKQVVKERELFYIKPVPGPGTYNPNTPNRKHSPSCFIIGRKHIRSYSATPPGIYQSDSRYIIGKNTSFSFSKAKRSELYVTKPDDPGPGKYYKEKSFVKTTGNSPAPRLKNRLSRKQSCFS